MEGEPDGKLLIATSMFNRYSAEMRAVTHAVERLSGYDPEAYYVIVTRIPNTLGYDGYMPLKSQFAFIFATSADKQPRIMAHELGHGAFYLRHPQDEYQILGSTGNLMDRYAIGTDLWKTQWDWVADPSFRIYAFQDEEDGASIGLGDLISDLDDAYLSWDGSLFVATPSGKSIQLPSNVSEIGFVSKHIGRIPLGSVVRFRTSEGNQYAAFYNFSKNRFEGYGLIKKNLQGEVGKDLIEKDSLGNLIYWKNPTETPSKAIAGVPTTCNVNVKQLDEGQVQGLPVNSKGEDALKGRNFYIDAKGQIVKVIQDAEACIIPPALNITLQTLLENADKSIFNPYGKGGLLVNYKTQAGSTFIYIGFNSDATEYYLQWFGNEWVEWTPQPWQQIQFGDIVLTIIEVCKYLIIENPQEFLDAVGSSPSIIAPFADGANAIWYAFKGDWKMAGISAISVLPFIGDGIGASLKATVKIGKRYQTFHLVGEGAELILKTGKRYQNLGNKVVDEALVALGIAINKYGNHVPVLAKIADKVAGPAQLRTMLRAIDDMPDAQREIFFKDLAENSKFADEFFAKVGDNPNLVESWKRLIDAPDAIRKNIDLLDDISSWPASWKLTKFGDGILVANNSGKQLGTIYSDKIVAPGRRVSGEAGNALLNRVPLTKNMKYDVDGFIYQTDELGRVVTTNADLDDIARIRLGNQQIRTVDVKDGVRGADQGGHIVGSRFFGPGEQINLYPQSANLNQGSWKQMENAWADAMVDKFDDAGNLIEKGKDVKVKVTAIFEGTSQRPVGFEVDYWIDGNLTTRTFPNN